MHWFNPPQVMALIEIARIPETSEATLRATLELSKRLEKDPVVCRDSKGFITTRAINAFRLECFRIWEEGVASPEEIDKAIRLAFRHPMGPFELADLVGLDTALAVEESLAETYGERFRPPEALRRLVNEGKLGRKSGEGFYRHK
jgi:3-hydroxybutyryl-CoA dehydrogenase